MITQIEYERLRQEIDDLKRELTSCETLSRINAKIIRELKQKLRDDADTAMRELKDEE